MQGKAAVSDQRENLNDCLRSWLTVGRKLRAAAGRNDFEAIGSLIALRDEILSLIQRIGPRADEGSDDPELAAETRKLVKQIEDIEQDVATILADVRGELSSRIGQAKKAIGAANGFKTLGDDLGQGRNVDNYQ